MTNSAKPADPVSKSGWRALRAILLLALAWHPDCAGAAGEDSPPMFSFSGFGTLGVVHSSENQADFTASDLQPHGAGYSRAWSPTVDSRIGAQAIANLTPQLSAVLQVISQQNYDATYAPHVEWANIKYEFTPEASLRVGRIVLPISMVSDSFKVGYSNPWVRPPVEIYRLVSSFYSDGVDASYRTHFGGVTDTIAGTYGTAKIDAPEQRTARARQEWAISDTAEYGAATLHVAYMHARLSVDGVSALTNAFRQFGPEGEALADEYGTNDKPVWFVALGAMYDPGSWFVSAEWGSAQLNSVLGAYKAWYVSGGYRLAAFTPYLTYAQLKADSATSDPGLNVSALPPSLAVPATALNAALNEALGSVDVQKTVSVGLRWDFIKNIDLKLQYDRSRFGAGSPGDLTNTQPGFRPGGSVSEISIAVDFVL